MKTLRLALAQINTTVGDMAGNSSKIVRMIGEARALGASLVAFPELAVTGYPPEDLLLKPRFIEDNLKALDAITRSTRGIAAVVGFVGKNGDIYNSAAVLAGGKLIDVYNKIYLPNYGVFDEYRYFQSGKKTRLYRLGSALIGVNICEDIWYPEGPTRTQALMGAEAVININASPYTMGKAGFKSRMLSARAADSSVIVASVNAVGGQDELVFDGGSVVFDETGEVIAEAKRFGEELLVVDLDLDSVFMRRLHDPRRRQKAKELKGDEAEIINIPAFKTKKPRLAPIKRVPALRREEEVYKALVLGVSDYVSKNGFKGVLIGLSGGVDSALVCAIARRALGKEKATAVFMPSRYTSRESAEDSRALARNLGVRLVEIPIDDIFSDYLSSLKVEFKGLPPDSAEENIQARIRGNILMALSNKFGHLVLTTGNKSEMSVGYATLYGDMAGGFAVIKDVPKTLVYEISRWINSDGEVIPERIIKKAPTAELRPSQKDTDTLPPYDVLDPILKAYIEEERSFDEMVAEGFDTSVVKKVISMVDGSEYKRRQAPPGIKITPKAFGRDRRFPITNRYKSS